MLISGIATLTLGILLIVNPVMTVISLVLFLGYYWIVNGIFTLAIYAHQRTPLLIHCGLRRLKNCLLTQYHAYASIYTNKLFV